MDASYPVVEACPSGTQRNVSGSCVCDNDMVWNNSTESCECPQYSSWDSTSGSCIVSIANMVWDFGNHRFVCQRGMGLSEETSQCVCRGNSIMVNNSCQCPANASFTNELNGICVCNPDFAWDSVAGECSSSPGASGSDREIAFDTVSFVSIPPSSGVAPSIRGEMEIDLTSPLYDGCYFDKDEYPVGKGYLATFDSFDCKIARYVGYGPDVSFPSILALIIPGFLFGKLGVIFVLLSLSFAILMIMITVRVVTTFLLSIVAIILLIYVSPIIIPLALFKSTKGIFDSWLKNIIGFAVQPILLFAYLAVFLTITEPILLGSAYFEGEMKGGRALVCPKDPMAVANTDSLLCLFGQHDGSAFGSVVQNSGLRGIGIGVATIADSATDSRGFISSMFMKILTIFKGVLLIYLFYIFIDKIPGIAAKLSGSTKLTPASPGFKSYMGKVKGFISGGQSLGKGAITGTAKRAKNVANYMKKDSKDNKK